MSLPISACSPDNHAPGHFPALSTHSAAWRRGGRQGVSSYTVPAPESSSIGSSLDIGAPLTWIAQGRLSRRRRIAALKNNRWKITTAPQPLPRPPAPWVRSTGPSCRHGNLDRPFAGRLGEAPVIRQERPPRGHGSPRRRYRGASRPWAGCCRAGTTGK